MTTNVQSLYPIEPVAPPTIQFLPPGPFEIFGREKNIPIVVDQPLAARLNRQLQFIRSVAIHRQGVTPRICFQHADEAIAAEVTELVWVGENPIQGIHARVRWTEAGRRAVEGLSFTRFSPVLNCEVDRFVGIAPNLGGLTNRPQYITIAPVISYGEKAGSVPEPGMLDPNTPADRDIFRLFAMP